LLRPLLFVAVMFAAGFAMVYASPAANAEEDSRFWVNTCV
jgi:hypothetical protein